MGNNKKMLSPEGRLVSLDAFRGFTMILLISSGFGFPYLIDYQFLGFFARQLTHHPWHGMYFWDLVQPFFMFIVGVAMPFSFLKRWERGDTWNQTFLHVIKRSVILFLLGVILHCAHAHKLVWELWNVLTQLAFTYLIAFLFLRKPVKTQIIISFAILLFNYLIYKFIQIPGFSESWVKDKNLGSFMDMVLLGKLNAGGGWVTINFIGSSVHTMWGVIAGLIIKSDREEIQKVKLLVIGGIAGVVLGLAIDPVTPIIKRICTSSFIIHSGGWCFLTLAFFYWIIDIKGYKRWTLFMIVVGTNPIFIYMFQQLLGGWTNNFIGIFTMPVLEHLGVAGKILQKNIVLLFLWYMTYWLYKRKIFIKI